MDVRKNTRRTKIYNIERRILWRISVKLYINEYNSDWIAQGRMLGGKKNWLNHENIKHSIDIINKCYSTQ